jgi:hypothetical protein
VPDFDINIFVAIQKFAVWIQIPFLRQIFNTVVARVDQKFRLDDPRWLLSFRGVAASLVLCQAYLLPSVSNQSVSIPI